MKNTHFLFSAERGKWWPIVAIAAGGMIMFISLGSRQGFGLFMLPLQNAGLISREQFSGAIAIQYLAWGIAAPFFGALADRHGSTRLLVAGAASYACGFLIAGCTSSTGWFALAIGVLIGIGLAATSYGVVNAAVGRAAPPSMRSRALTSVASIGALGQCLVLFLTNGAVHLWGPRVALQAHAGLVALIVPCACLLAAAPKLLAPRAHGARDSAGAGIGALLAQGDFRRLLFGFGCSGFQVMFVMTHLPAMAVGLGFDSTQASTALAVISALSFLGTVLFSALTEVIDKRRLLRIIYLGRAVMALAFPFLPFNLAGLLLFWRCSAWSG